MGDKCCPAFHMVGLLISFGYKSGDVWNVGDLFVHQPFENGISHFFEGGIGSIAHCWEGECMTKMLILSVTEMNECL